ncbi:MAG: PAS domain S-box-containing protein [Planctomycetota bacterium]|jgi:PAS domain S-box-containing protein
MADSASERLLIVSINTMFASSRQKKKHTLTRQLGVPFLVSSSIIFAIIVGVAIFSYRGEFRKVLEVPENLAINVSAEVGQFINFTKDTLLLVARILETDEVGIDMPTHEFLQGLLDESESLLGFQIYTPEGQQVATYLDTGKTKIVDPGSYNLAELVPRVVASGEEILFEPIVSIDKTSVAVWSFPLWVGDSLTGVMHAFLDVESLGDILKRQQNTTDGVVYIIGPRGTVELASTAGIAQETEIREPILTIESFIKKSPTIEVYTGIAGKKVLGSWRQVPGTDWAIVTEVATGPLNSRLNGMIAILLVLLLLLLLVLWYEVRLVRRVLLLPLRHFVEIIDMFGRGERSARVELPITNEIGTLAGSFNTMATDLQSLYGGLEEKVREKTTELRGVLTQVSDQKQELEEGAVRDNALFESVGAGLVFVDTALLVVRFNRIAADILGYKDAELLGKKWPEVMRLEHDQGELIPEEDMPLVQAMRTKQTVSVIPVLSRYIIRTATGEVIPISITATPVVVEGQVIGGVAVFRNVTKEKEIDRKKNEFISFTSHQLRTPLTNAKWITERMLAGKYDPLSEKQTEAVSNIYEVNERLIDLVASLLNISRLEMGVVESQPEPLEVREVVDSVLLEHEMQTQQKSITVHTDVVEYDDPILLDPKLFQMILQNLVSNAIKYTPAEGVIDIHVQVENAVFSVEVTDSGYGIPLSEQERIYEKLFRGSNVSNRSQGTGLGLYMTKLLVELMHGTISFTSKENEGSTFRIEFPLSL